MSLLEIVIDIPANHQKNIFGQLDSNIKKIEKTLNVTLVSRDNEIKLVGDSDNIKKAKNIISDLYELSKKGTTITDQTVNYCLSLAMDDKEGSIIEIDSDIICHTISGKPIKPKTLGQKQYVDQIRNKMITFGIGPAGTGKTYLAIAMAVTAFKNDNVNKIILTRPAIEAGEKLGFLPGDLQSKVDPYLRPLYDALNQIMGNESFVSSVEKGLIEVAPLAYMRGRTLDNAFIILDEAQNTTPAQMKMFLTRIGYGSKAVVNGDLTQKDLPHGTESGLENAIRVLSKVGDLGFSYLTDKDVVRHPLVQKIVKAYDNYDKKSYQSKRDSSKRSYGKTNISRNRKSDTKK